MDVDDEVDKVDMGIPMVYITSVHDSNGVAIGGGCGWSGIYSVDNLL